MSRHFSWIQLQVGEDNSIHLWNNPLPCKAVMVSLMPPRTGLPPWQPEHCWLRFSSPLTWTLEALSVALLSSIPFLTLYIQAELPHPRCWIQGSSLVKLHSVTASPLICLILLSDHLCQMSHIILCFVQRFSSILPLAISQFLSAIRKTESPLYMEMMKMKPKPKSFNYRWLQSYHLTN